MKTRILSITIIIAGILIAATNINGVQSVSAWTFKSWNELYPDSPLCYTFKTREQRDACYQSNSEDKRNGDLTNIEPDIDNEQDGLFNQNSQTSQICIAWTCNQSTFTTQTVDNPTLLGNDNENIVIDNTEEQPPFFLESSFHSSTTVSHNFKVNVILTYKNAEAIRGDDLRIAVYDSHDNVNYKRVDLSNYKLTGKAIKVQFSYYNNEIPVGKSGRACVENLTYNSDKGLGRVNCNSFENSDEGRQENVNLVIPGSG